MILVSKLLDRCWVPMIIHHAFRTGS